MPEPVDLDDSPEWSRGRQWHARQANARREWQQLRDLALTVLCRDCRVAGGEPCVIRDRAGTAIAELTRFPAHTSRINDARKAAR